MKTISIDVDNPNAIKTLSDLPSFPPNRRATLSTHLGKEITEDSVIDLELRTAAFSYSGRKSNSRSTIRSTIRTRQRKAARAVNKALNAVEDLHAEDIMPLVREGGDDAYDRLRALTRLLEHWAPLMSEVAARKLPRAREKNDLLTQMCGWLKSIYEDHSDRAVTHNTMIAGVDVGEPVSSFDSFVVTFFQHVDPAVTSKQLCEPLKRVVWPSRRKVPVRSLAANRP